MKTLLVSSVTCATVTRYSSPILLATAQGVSLPLPNSHMCASTSATRRVAISSCCSVRRIRVKSAAKAMAATTNGTTKANSSITLARALPSRLFSLLNMSLSLFTSTFQLFNSSTFQLFNLNDILSHPRPYRKFCSNHTAPAKPARVSPSPRHRSRQGAGSSFPLPSSSSGAPRHP